MKQPPVVLCLSGHDPTGGAGIQADIETLNRIGCHPCTVVTALTAQDTCNVSRIFPQNVEAFTEQVRLLSEDVHINAIKIGLLGSAEIALAVCAILRTMPDVPVVLDPILAAGGGLALTKADLIQVIQTQLLPLTTVLTPNSVEARALAGSDSLDECAKRLLASGCKSVLITGTHDEGGDVVNRLYRGDKPKASHWQRLPGCYHGSGCTLASALAGFLALGFSLEEAADRAQDFTWNALASGFCLGRGQLIPDRIGG